MAARLAAILLLVGSCRSDLTAAPTLAPTHMPTAHSCDSSHGCETETTMCVIKHENYECDYYVCLGYECDCKEGFVADPSSDTSCLAKYSLCKPFKYVEGSGASLQT